MQIHIDAKNGNIEGVSRALAEGVPVDSPDVVNKEKRIGRKKFTPLMVGLGSNRAGVDMVQFLIDNGADVNRLTKVNGYHTYPLAVAVQHRDLEKVKLLLDNGADLHYKTPEGYDVLIDAMFSPYHFDEHGTDLLEVVEFLLGKGVSTSGRTHLIQSTKVISALSLASDMNRYGVVKLLLDYGADRSYLEWNELMYAVVFGTLEEVKAALTGESMLHERDVSERTPFLLAVLSGDVSKAEFLLSAGSERRVAGFMGRTAFLYAVENEDLEMITFLARNGFDIDEPEKILEVTPLILAIRIGSEKCIKHLLALGADINKKDKRGGKPIARTEDREIMELLIGEGAKFEDIGDDMRKQFRGTAAPSLDDIPKSQYLAQKYRVFGTSNPEKMEIDFWRAMVACGCAAWEPRYRFGEKDVYDLKPGDRDAAVWCFERYGMSITRLPDGRVIEIAGEHEDSYATDFLIYNDVVVHYPDGNFDIYGYPEEVFPPTDFHTATLVGDSIYIIGNLGYTKQRRSGETPVFRLNTVTYEIERVETTGEAPGWISRHDTDLIDNNTIRISGGYVWSLKDENEKKAWNEKKEREAEGKKESIEEDIEEDIEEKVNDKTGKTVTKKKWKFSIKRTRDGASDKYIDNVSSYLLDLSTMTWSLERR